MLLRVAVGGRLRGHDEKGSGDCTARKLVDARLRGKLGRHGAGFAT